MILSRTSIIKEIEKGNLKFDPRIENDQVGPSSIDLRLGNTFIHLDKELQEEQSVGADVRWYIQEQPWRPFVDKYGRQEVIADSSAIELKPFKFVLGFTLEYIQLPPWLAARVEGKSGHARRGLLVHMTAPTVQAGWHGQLQLEFCNLGPATLLLKPRLPICQLVLEQVTEPEQYGGEFHQQAP